MKQFRLLKPIWLAAMLLLLSSVPLTATAYDFMVDGLCYNMATSGNTVSVTYQNSSTPRYSNLSGNLVIPSTVSYNGTTYTVTSISDYAFAGCSDLVSVTIPATITEIGISHSGTKYEYLPFYNCTSLKKVVFEDGSNTLYLGAIVNSTSSKAKGAFAFCPLEEIYLGRNLSYSRASYIFEANPEYYGYSAFYNQSRLTRITIGETVTEITPYLFYKNESFTFMALPHVQSIGTEAFSNCSKLTTLNLGDAMVSIGDGAFSTCTSITKLTFPNTTKTIGNSAFCNCSSVTEITTGSGLTSLGASAFYGCTSLTAIILPNQFKTMGESAFENCTKLTIAQLGESITAIPAEAFKNCIALSEMNIPATTVSIGNQAFFNDSGLATITMNEGLKTIGSEVFWNNSGVVRFTIPGSVTSIGTNCFYGCTSVSYLIFSNGTQELTINNDACRSSIIDALTSNSMHRNRYNDYFYDCPIRFLTLGRNLIYTYRDNISMYDWNGSSFVEISRASGPFVNKKSLQSVTIGSNVTYLYHHLFDGCKELSSLTMGTNIKQIYTYAFRDCDKLASIEFPVTLRLIDKYAFYDCDLLASTIFKETSDHSLSINESAFMRCVSLTNVTYPGQLVSLGSSSYRDCTKLRTTIFNNTTIDNNKLVLNNYTFSGCTLLKNVTFPNHLYKINNYVYEKCPSLNTLSFPMNLISIGNYVFANTPNLANIRFENSSQVITLGYGAADAGGAYLKSAPLFSNSSLNTLYIGRNITYEASSTYGYSPFYNQSSLTDVEFSQTGTVTYCHDYLLYYVNNCKELLLPESLTSIGGHTFANMSKLKGISIPNNVTTMGIYAFSVDKSLKYAKLSTGCSWLKEGVFSDCDSLEYITIPPVVTRMDTKLFASCKSLATVTFEGSPDLVEVAYGASNSEHGLFRNCPIITLNLNRWLSYDTEAPSHSPFYSIKTLKNLNIGEYVGVIDKYMFSYCKGLEQVYLPDNIESVGLWGFRGCSSLTTVRFSQRLSQISDYGFSGCTQLDNVVFPASMTSVADNSFSDCTSLKKLDLGNNLLIIGPSAFKNCTALEGITIPETLYGLGVEAFANCTSLPNVTIRSITSVGKQAFQGCTGLQWISLSDKTTSLGEDSFNGCSGIKYVKSYAEYPPEGLVNFPDSVVSTGTLYVPSNSIAYYAASPTWENWFKIQALKMVTSLSINKQELTLTENETEQLTVTVMPADASDGGVIWASSDEAVATVSTDGLVTAVAPGSVTITATTIDGSNLSATCEVTVLSAVQQGDANGDGNVTVSDVVLIAQKSVGMSPTPFIEANADVNHDGNINVTDVVLTANIAVGVALTPRKALVTEDESANLMTASTLNIRNGETQDIVVSLNNTTAFSAFQMQVVMPEGLSLARASLSDRAVNHAMLVHDSGENTRLLAFSLDNTPFSDNSGTLLTLTVSAENGFDANSCLYLQDILLTECDGATHHLNDMALNNGVATSVSDVYSDTRIYTQNSNLIIETSEAGVAQIVMASGISRMMEVHAGRNVLPMSSNIYIVRFGSKVAKVRIP